MATTTLEERVTALESEVTLLKYQLVSVESPHELIPDAEPLTEQEILAEIERIRHNYPALPRPKPTNPDFLERSSGVFADDPAFERVVRFSEEKRERERREASRGR